MQTTPDTRYLFINNGGNSGNLLRTKDWSDHPLGDPARWPGSLQSAISICLASPFPIAIYWGPEHFLLYNDAYSPIPGDKHPWAFAQPGKVAWSEIWHLLDEQFNDVLTNGTSVHVPDSMLPMNRFGYTEECYFNYTLSPIYDPSGKVAGIFNAVIETSYKVINERRNQLLYRLSMLAHNFSSSLAAYENVLMVLGEHNMDIPFAAIYSWSKKETKYILVSIEGIGKELIRVSDEFLFDVVAEGKTRLFEIDDLLTGLHACNNWPEPCREVVLIPLNSGAVEHNDIMLAGINPGKRVDQDYQQFLETAAIHITTAINNGASVARQRNYMERIKASEDELQFAINAAELGTFDLDPVTMRFSGNARLKSWFGLEKYDEIDLHMGMVVIPEPHRTRVAAAIEESMQPTSGGDYTIEYPIIHPVTGEKRMVAVKGKTLFNERGEPTRLSGTVQDITSVREALQNLEQSNQRLQIALEAANLGSYELEISSGKMICTDQCKANFGVTPAESLDFSLLLSRIVPSMREYVRQEMIEAIKEKRNYHAEYEVIWPDKSRHWINAYGKASTAASGDVIIGVTYETTMQVIAKRELEKALEQQRLSRETASLGTFDLDLLNGTMDWDQRCRLLFGISHQAPVSYEKDFIPHLHPDDRERVIKIIEKVYDKAATNGNYDIEYRTVGADDGQVRWVKAKGKAFFNEQDIPVRFIGSVFDITEQKENELRKNDFIGMVSHELKTPLTILKSYVQLLAQNAQKTGNTFESNALMKVDQQVNKMSRMINSFLNLARFESGTVQIHTSSVAINELIEDVVSELNLIQSTHSIQFSKGPACMVQADAEKISQVVHNLISNAIKYSPKGTSVYVRCEQKDRYIKVSVRDEGIGIRESDISRLFERFFRVEDPNTKHISGFGIGLYLSAELIRRHGGTIWAESVKGNGSSFYFTLPVA